MEQFHYRLVNTAFGSLFCKLLIHKTVYFDLESILCTGFTKTPVVYKLNDVEKDELN